MEKLKTLSWHWQLLMLVGLVAVLYGGVYYLYTSGLRAETATINEQVIALQQKNEAAKIATQKISEFRSLFASKQAEYDELKVLLPEEQEITNVLQGLQDSARDSQLTVMRFSPKDASQQDFVMAKAVEVEVDSNFNSLRAFFDKMAKLQRIVSISDFSLKQLAKQSPSKTLHAQFLLTAYYASPENLNNINAPVLGPDGKPLPAKPGAPAAVTPAAPAPAN
jgi:type IV pilus assembly protein PilO